MIEKKISIKEIKENQQIESIFLVRDKNNGMTKGGKPYIALTIVDKTGEIKARIWDNAERLGSLFIQGDIVKAKGYCVLYQNALQLNISALEKYCDDSLHPEDFLPASKTDPDLMFAELMDYSQMIKDVYLKQLIVAVFADDTILKAFKTAPAAKTIHHDYIGGLLEHTLNVTRLAFDISKHYPNVNKDILITASMLHDIGKVYELSYEKNFDYTDRGRLIGHIALGDELINSKIQTISEFPQDIAMIIRHMLLSHHGQYEFGSPKRPKTMEALLLSYLDDVDAKMYGFAQFIKKEKNGNSKWTSYYKLFDRYLYTDTFIDEEEKGD